MLGLPKPIRSWLVGVFLVENEGVLPAWSEVADALGVGGVQLCELFGDYLYWWVVELEWDFGSGGLEL